jgi:deoxyribodipyrimidine photo-lyase
VPGFYESQELAALVRAVDIPVQVHGGNTLFDRQQLPFELASMPPQYTPFRQAVESLQPPVAEGAVPLPTPPPGLRAATIEPPTTAPHPAFIVRGGAEAGLQRLQKWMFRERAIEHYAETRNELSGLFFSSFLSPWLASGGLAVRRVAGLLRDYEREYGASQSSRWLYRELLWREFFHWRALADAASLFRQGGARRKRLLKTFEPRQFARWCAGATDFPLVNALMHQLVATGWMSNRGRQVVASCLVNELGHDWRYGAAFFEKHLLDHDVAVNYGNWQYIAGVGADPRGGRHFNLARQQALYDPQGEFIALWQGDCPPQPEYVTDAADWPISG